MRKLGTPSIARLLVTVPPSDASISVPAGTVFTTNANLTNGEQYSFVSEEAVIIPSGQTSVFLTVVSQFVGRNFNVPANSITGVSAINVSGLTATNPQPSSGGSDVETYQEVQERFFTLIRRPNPVSSQDWGDFFTDFYGVGTQTSVQPNRPNQGTYNYLTDYKLPNGQVSFFVLGPDGVELNRSQLQRGQNVINYSVPVENQAHLYPITLSQVQYNLTVEVDANGGFGDDLKNSSLNFRDRLFEVLRPGNVFPSTVDPTVMDVDASFYSTFPDTSRFVDPHITASAAYNTPPLLSPDAATYTDVYTFDPVGELLTVNDLVKVVLPNVTYYPVLTNFTPYSTEKKDQTVYNNLVLQQIKPLVSGSYLQGQVCYWSSTDGGDNGLHVILENLTVESTLGVSALINKGKISPTKTYSAWTVGNSYQAISPGGLYNPEIVQYDYASDEFIPDLTSTVPVSKRPGALTWVVNQNFTLQPATNSITGASSQFKIGASVVPQELIEGETFTSGTWVYTPQVGSGPNPVADPYFNYVDIRLGVVNKYAFVVTTFTYTPNGRTTSSYFDELVETGALKEIVVQTADKGLPIAKYNPRFPATTYLEYRESVDSAPEYYIASKYFTPTSTVAQELANQGLIIPLYLNTGQYTAFVKDLTAVNSTLRKPTRMFRFFKGDRTFFRQGSELISYTATTSVHPLFEFYIYLQNGVFTETARYVSVQFESQNYIPYFDPKYVEYSEDTVLSEDGRNLYRTMLAFTPDSTVVNWTNTEVVNTARNEEYAGNLLRYVDQYVCEEPIRSQLGRDISAIKLGIAQITIVPKNRGRFVNSQQQVKFVWENTSTLNETPQLSWYSGTPYPYSPPDYKEGTLKL
jgi:hypothetical protein